MKSVLRLANQERAELFNGTAQGLGMDAVMVEKDFGVCWTLRQLFTLPGIGDHLIFKGGTSLSKVWRAIERFSEDIDVSLSRAWLGFSGDHDPELPGSRKKRAQQLNNLSAACATKIRDELLPLLRERARSELGDTGWSFAISEKDSQTIIFLYPTALAESVMPYIPRRVKIEGGARSDDWPAQEKIIRPYVAEAYADRITDAEVMVKALSIERTFWEKATILHAEAHCPAERLVPPRYSRHYSDLAVLAGLEAGRKALECDDLRTRVVAHKQIFFPAAWASMDTAVPGQFKLIPSPERLTTLERDYLDMQQMFFRTPLSWSEIIARLRELEQVINARQG